MLDPADAYREVQDRIVALVLSCDDEQITTRVPACPDWTVRDVLAHHVGVAVDSATGNIAEFVGFDLLDQWRDTTVATARDRLTARQVDERRGRSVAELADEWRAATEVLAPMMRGERSFPDPVPAYFGSVLVNDVVVHEGDLRQALGEAPVRDGAALSLALVGYGFSLDRRIRLLGLPPLVLTYDGKPRVLGGEGEPGATLRADRYELVRILASRRTHAEILAADWSGDAEPYAAALPEYGPVTVSPGE